MLSIATELVVTTIAMGAVYWLGYSRGKYVARTQRLEVLAKNARQVANQAKADADVLDGVLPPRVRRARVKGTSRRGLND